MFLKSYLRRNITSATRRPALKADQGHHLSQGSSVVSNEHSSLGMLGSGWNSLSGELLKPVFLINLSWPLAGLSIRQEEKILTWGINFQKYLDNWKLSYFLRCLQSPKETKFENLTSCFSLSERKPMFWTFKSSSFLIWMHNLLFPYSFFSFSLFAEAKVTKSLFKSMIKHLSS